MNLDLDKNILSYTVSNKSLVDYSLTISKIVTKMTLACSSVQKVGISIEVDSTTSTKEHKLSVVGVKNYSNLLKIFIKMKEKVVFGIPRIKKVIIQKDEGSVDENNYNLQTEGSNLKAISRLNEVDMEKVYTTDIIEVYKFKGIEEARNKIIRECYQCLSLQGLPVDIRHITLVADLMTLSGSVTGLGRFGIAATKNSLISKAAFESTSKILKDAAFFSEEDELKGVLESLITGNTIPVGTGGIKLEYNQND